MQIVVIVHCTKGRSVRDAIVSTLSSSHIEPLVVSETERKTRNPGWTKIHSSDQKRGAINIRWEGSSSTLECRVVTRGSQKTSPVLGDFVTYLMNNHRTRIKAITVTSR